MIVLGGHGIRMPIPCVLAMGKFESIHTGHRALINQMKELAHAQPGLATALVVFEPHPYRVLVDVGYKPLYTRNERELLVRELGVEYLLEYPFDRDIAALSPEDFCRKLFEELQAKVIVVGEGYRFGYNRMGTVEILRRKAAQYDARIHVVAHKQALRGFASYDEGILAGDAAKYGEIKTSTSTIRRLIAEGKLNEVAGLLGHLFFISGEVAQWIQPAGMDDFPTIVLCPHNEKFLPPDGVYATLTTIDGCCYRGVTSIAMCPTSAAELRSVETRLIGFNSCGDDLCGKYVRVEFGIGLDRS